MRHFSIALAACVLTRVEAYMPKRTAVSLSDRSTAASPPSPPYASAETVCAKCGLNADGVVNCCSAGGSWHGTCGDGLKHTSQEGFNACKGVAPGGAEAPGEEHAWEKGEEHAWELDHIPPPPPSKHGVHPARGRNATLEQQLKNALLSAQDPMVPPSTGEHGVRVSMQYRIFKVIKVDIGSGELSLKIWRRSVWYDPRLQWDPKEWGGISNLRAYPGSNKGVDDRLWRPPLVTTNTIAREPDTVETGGAWIKSDGRVWHSVPGTIDLSCRFTGLVNFPNDQLTCAMEVGSWTYSDRVVNLTYFTSDLPWGWPAAPYAKGHTWTNVGTARPTGTENGPPTELVNGAVASLLRTKLAQVQALPGEPGLTVKVSAEEWDVLGVTGLKRNHFVKVDDNYLLSQDPLPCAEMGAQSRASGVSYQEYEVTDIECLTNTRTYPVDAEAHWTSLWLVIHIKRTSGVYCYLTIITPGVLITLLSFATLWLDVTKSGERISFGATMLLTILVLMTLVGQVVPRCGEMLWIHLVNWVNFLFCLFSTLQSFVISYICMVEKGDDTGHEMAGGESDSRDAKREKFHQKRQQEEWARAKTLDYWSRRVLPTSYFVVLTFIMTANIDDDYQKNYAAPTYRGFSGWRVYGFHHRWFLITTLVVVAALCGIQFRGKLGQAFAGSGKG